MKTYIVCAAAALLAALGLVGCNDKAPPAGGGEEPYSVQIVMLVPSDTLRYSPGDSASAQGYVPIRDSRGNALPGVHVAISLARQDLGRIVYPSARCDTTDSLGRVNFVFQASSAAGASSNTIHAQFGNREDNYTLWIQPAEIVFGPLQIVWGRTHIALNDSSLVSVTVTDTNGVGVRGAMIPLTALGGVFSPDTLLVTDSTGRASREWHPRGYGLFTITLHWQNQLPSETVWVDSLLGTP